MDGRLDPATMRAAWWTACSLWRARHQLRFRAFTEVRVSTPPSLPDRAERAVHAILRRSSATCLERALVLQRWFAAHGSSRDVVIGVTSPTGDFAAHAWLDGEDDVSRYTELTRLPA